MFGTTKAKAIKRATHAAKETGGMYYVIYERGEGYFAVHFAYAEEFCGRIECVCHPCGEIEY